MENINLLFDLEDDIKEDEISKLNTTEMPLVILINLHNVKLISLEYLKKIIRIIIKNKDKFKIDSKCYVNLYIYFKNLLQFTNNNLIIRNLEYIINFLEYLEEHFFEFSEFEQIKDLYEKKRKENDYISNNFLKKKKLDNKDSQITKPPNSLRLIPFIKIKAKNIKNKIVNKIKLKKRFNGDFKEIIENFLIQSDLIIKNNKNILKGLFDFSFNNINILLVFIFSPFNYEISDKFKNKVFNKYNNIENIPSLNNINTNKNNLQKISWNKFNNTQENIDNLNKKKSFRNIPDDLKKFYNFRSFLATMVITEKKNHLFFISMNNNYMEIFFEIFYKGLKENYLFLNTNILVVLFRFFLINEKYLSIYYFIKYNFIYFIFENILKEKCKSFIIELLSNSKLFDLNINLFSIFWNYLFIVGIISDLIKIIVNGSNNLGFDKFNIDYTNPEIESLLEYLKNSKINIKNNKNNKNYNKIMNNFYSDIYDPFINEQTYDLKEDIDLIKNHFQKNNNNSEKKIKKISKNIKNSSKKISLFYKPKINLFFKNEKNNKDYFKKIKYFKNIYYDKKLEKISKNNKLLNTIKDHLIRNKSGWRKNSSNLKAKTFRIKKISTKSVDNSNTRNFSNIHPKKINTYKNNPKYLKNFKKNKKVNINNEEIALNYSEIIKYLGDNFIQKLNFYNKNSKDYKIYKNIFLKIIENNNYELIMNLIFNILYKIELLIDKNKFNTQGIIYNIEFLINTFDILQKESINDINIVYNLKEIANFLIKNFNLMENNLEILLFENEKKEKIKIQNKKLKKLNIISYLYFKFFLNSLYIIYLKNDYYIHNLNIRAIDIIIDTFDKFKVNENIFNLFFNFWDFLILNNYENNLILVLINSNFLVNLSNKLEKVYKEEILLDNHYSYIITIIKVVISMINLIKKLNKYNLSLNKGYLINSKNEKFKWFLINNIKWKIIKKKTNFKFNFEKLLKYLKQLNSYKKLNLLIKKKYVKQYRFINKNSEFKKFCINN